jgi:hypothetical protein
MKFIIGANRRVPRAYRQFDAARGAKLLITGEIELSAEINFAL